MDEVSSTGSYSSPSSSAFLPDRSLFALYYLWSTTWERQEWLRSRQQVLILVQLLCLFPLIVLSAVQYELQCQTSQAWSMVLGFLLTTTDVSHDIPPPPAEQFYDTLEYVLQSIREFTKEYRYALTKIRSKKGTDGEVNKVYLQCDRGKFRTSRVQERGRQRFRGTRFLDCPFSGILIHSKDIGAWIFEIRNSGHNLGTRRIISDNQPDGPEVNPRTSERGSRGGGAGEGVHWHGVVVV